MTGSSPKAPYDLRPLAFATLALATFLLTLAGSWLEGRWRNPAGTAITLRVNSSADVTGLAGQLQSIDGVLGVVLQTQAELSQDETDLTPWRTVQVWASQSNRSDLLSVPPDPSQRPLEGRFPSPYSMDEVLLGFEMSRVVGRGIGEYVSVNGRDFRVVGILAPSPRSQGNLLMLSAAAMQATIPASSVALAQLLVFPEPDQTPVVLADLIRRAVKGVEVVSPSWESARAKQERATLAAVTVSAALLSLLVVLFWLPAVRRSLKASVFLAGVLTGLVCAQLAAAVINGHAARVWALTPLQPSMRFALVEAAVCAILLLLPLRFSWEWSWSGRCLIAGAVVAVGVMGIIAFGTMKESLALSLEEAQKSSSDWVAVQDTPASQELLWGLGRLPGVRGYSIEALAGAVDDDETGWLGGWPNSGVLYGLEHVGGEGTSSVPYLVSMWKGRPLSANELSEAVVGFDLAQQRGLKVGDALDVRGTLLEVVGIRRHLPYDAHNGANYRVEVSMKTLRRVLHDTSVVGEVTYYIPPAKTREDKALYLQTASERLGAGLQTVDESLARIAGTYPATWTIDRKDARSAVQRAQALYGGAFTLLQVLLLAPGLCCVASAFAYKFAEDRQRIGLVQAFGADASAVLGSYLQRALALGVASGMVGICGGWVVASLLSGVGPAPSAEPLLAPRLGAGVAFATMLSTVVAAAFPAFRAVRWDVAHILYGAEGSSFERAPDAINEGLCGGLLS